MAPGPARTVRHCAPAADSHRRRIGTFAAAAATMVAVEVAAADSALLDSTTWCSCSPTVDATAMAWCSGRCNYVGSSIEADLPAGCSCMCCALRMGFLRRGNHRLSSVFQLLGGHAADLCARGMVVRCAGREHRSDRVDSLMVRGARSPASVPRCPHVPRAGRLFPRGSGGGGR